jgi:hypothetical protein
LLDFRSKNARFADSFGRKRYGWCPLVWMCSFFFFLSVEKEYPRKKKWKNEITAKSAKDQIHVKANKGKTVNSLGTKK